MQILIRQLFRDTLQEMDWMRAVRGLVSYLPRYNSNDWLESRKEAGLAETRVFIWNARKFIFCADNRMIQRVEYELDNISGGSKCGIRGVVEASICHFHCVGCSRTVSSSRCCWGRQCSQGHALSRKRVLTILPLSGCQRILIILSTCVYVRYSSLLQAYLPV